VSTHYNLGRTWHLLENSTNGINSTKHSCKRRTLLLWSPKHYSRLQSSQVRSVAAV